MIDLLLIMASLVPLFSAVIYWHEKRHGRRFGDDLTTNLLAIFLGVVLFSLPVWAVSWVVN